MSQPQPRIDLGRVLAVSVFGFLLWLNVAGLTQSLSTRNPLSILNGALTIAFYLLLIGAYLKRTPSSRTDRRWSSWVVAFLGTFCAFAVPLVSNGPRDAGVLAGVAASVLALGSVAMLWVLGALGSNISVVPQAREVVSHGPYALVRHPLYAAEFVGMVGLCLNHTGPGPWAIMMALIVFQVMRARREEELLCRELPGYAEYRSRTPMLIPVPGRS